MKAAEFKWGPLSNRQKMLLSWWTDNSPYKDYEGIIADGAIRSGKTIAMGFSFVVWAMTRYNGEAFAICGKTIGTVRRNVVRKLKQQLRARGYKVEDHRSDNVLEISKGTVSNLFYLFGGKDEASQDLVQGITLAGCFLDEVALMPKSFIDQVTGRCSVDGSKFWFNCNPASPQHYFYVEWICHCRQRRLVYLHFTMDDNLTLTERIKDRYKALYAGVFYQRYILGLWVMAEGLIYDMFHRENHVLQSDLLDYIGEQYVSCDFGIQNATVFLLWQKTLQGKWVCRREYYYSGRDNKIQKTVKELSEGMETILPRDRDGLIIKPKQIIVDPSASALITELRNRGYHVLSAKNDVLDGISDVSTMLRQNGIGFDASCINTINEFGSYAWDAKAANNGEDRPIKTNDHAMDAVRYFVVTMRLVNKNNKELKRQRG